MDEQDLNNLEDLNSDPPQPPSAASKVMRGAIALFIVLIACSLGWYFAIHKPVAKKDTTIEKQATLVETIPAVMGEYPIEIEVMGQVKPAQSADLKAQVSGQILQTSPEFIPGGFLKKGDVILNIDPADYQLDIKSKEAALRQAKAALSLEMGKQAIAKDELKILQQTTGKTLSNTSLSLRKPQLEQAQADVAAAQVALDLSKLNLERTNLTAPFDALVVSKNVSTGDQITAQEALMTLAATNEYWVELSVPVKDLHWLKFPQSSETQGANARIYQDSQRGIREGRLIKNTGSLDSQSRLSTLIVAIQDPLLLAAQKQNAYPLILNDYVRVVLEGKTLKNVFKIPQTMIRDSQYLWIENNGKLDIRPVSIAYEDRNFSYITHGLKAGENIITSGIPAPIQGMDIQPSKTMVNTDNKESTAP